MSSGPTPERFSVNDGKERALTIADRLREIYGVPEVHRLDPLDELILTILSQNTNDVNRDRAWRSLRARFSTWEEVLDAPTEVVEESIRVGGLSEVKAARIQAALRRIRDECGRLSLDHLGGMTLDEARSYLLSFDGVGPKTAATVLLFSLGRPAFPVDTHVHRVSGRLGLIDAGTTAECAHEILAGLFPPERYMEVHINLIHLGRDLCAARRPRCRDCPLLDLCPHGLDRTGDNTGEGSRV